MKKATLIIALLVASATAFSQDTEKSKPSIVTDSSKIKPQVFILQGSIKEFEYLRVVIQKSKLSYEEVKPLMDWIDKQLLEQISKTKQ